MAHIYKNNNTSKRTADPAEWLRETRRLVANQLRRGTRIPRTYISVPAMEDAQPVFSRIAKQLSRVFDEKTWCSNPAFDDRIPVELHFFGKVLESIGIRELKDEVGFDWLVDEEEEEAIDISFAEIETCMKMASTSYFDDNLFMPQLTKLGREIVSNLENPDDRKRMVRFLLSMDGLAATFAAETAVSYVMITQELFDAGLCACPIRTWLDRPRTNESFYYEEELRPGYYLVFDGAEYPYVVGPEDFVKGFIVD